MTTKQNTPEMEDLFKDLAQAGQCVAQTFLNNMPNLIHSYKDISKAWLTLGSSIVSNPNEEYKIQQAYFDFYKKQIEMWQQISQHIQEDKKNILPNGDKRFKATEWNEYPYYFYIIHQSYLMASQLVTNIIEKIDIDETTKNKLLFYTRLFVDALSPSNFFLTNPEAIKLAQQSGGESLRKGFQNLIDDMKKGRISQTDFSSFEVGKNLALTEGSIIFENELIQLIQYKPLSKKVCEIPLLIIPPWINRFYILDLEPHNSFARFAVEQGFTVFMISWRVPKGEMGKISFDDYAETGAMTAMEVIREITGVKKVNAIGYCIGGTLLGSVAAVLAAREDKQDKKSRSQENKNYLNTTTFLATMLDFSDYGALSAVVDLPLVEKLEKEIGGEGILSGRDMTNAFNMVRSNDLIWKYVVNNYLKGKDPVPYSILFWTNDNTNMPGKMYTYYLRNFIIENKLSKKNALTICGTLVDLGKIINPCYIVGTAEDHISPCHTAFTTTRLVGGEAEFILGESGHVAGIVNPPNNGKYGYYSDGEKNKDLTHFRNTAKHHQESWWLHWARWLKKHSGKQIIAPSKQGNKKHEVIELAPGRYVKEQM
ncbi:MAG: class I poly(R)-hydroxyalkanoic acid synthase [Bacteroidota bacterium]